MTTTTQPERSMFEHNLVLNRPFPPLARPIRLFVPLMDIPAGALVATQVQSFEANIPLLERLMRPQSGRDRCALVALVRDEKRKSYEWEYMLPALVERDDSNPRRPIVCGAPYPVLSQYLRTMMIVPPDTTSDVVKNAGGWRQLLIRLLS